MSVQMGSFSSGYFRSVQRCTIVSNLWHGVVSPWRCVSSMLRIIGISCGFVSSFGVRCEMSGLGVLDLGGVNWYSIMADDWDVLGVGVSLDGMGDWVWAGTVGGFGVRGEVRCFGVLNFRGV